ncbi:hypothetical protein [Methylobacterium fujisawaense]|uniref:hypothetical protein n=1 Tax=Methylobacterium fujisawaense TaxID=107400 RepID=UPI00313D6AE4
MLKPGEREAIATWWRNSHARHFILGAGTAVIGGACGLVLSAAILAFVDFN